MKMLFTFIMIISSTESSDVTESAASVCYRVEQSVVTLHDSEDSCKSYCDSNEKCHAYQYSSTQTKVNCITLGEQTAVEECPLSPSGKCCDYIVNVKMRDCDTTSTHNQVTSTTTTEAALPQTTVVAPDYPLTCTECAKLNVTSLCPNGKTCDGSRIKFKVAKIGERVGCIDLGASGGQLWSLCNGKWEAVGGSLNCVAFSGWMFKESPWDTSCLLNVVV